MWKTPIYCFQYTPQLWRNRNLGECQDWKRNQWPFGARVDALANWATLALWDTFFFLPQERIGLLRGKSYRRIRKTFIIANIREYLKIHGIFTFLDQFLSSLSPTTHIEWNVVECWWKHIKAYQRAQFWDIFETNPNKYLLTTNQTHNINCVIYYML